MSERIVMLPDACLVTGFAEGMAPVSLFMKASRAYCDALDFYDRKSTPENLKALTLARRAMREAYREEQEVSK